MTVEAMRTYISDTYNSNVIRGRNICDMGDRQVIAIYRSIIRRGTKPVKTKKQKDIQTEQLNLFDLLDLLGGTQNG